jgi:aryl carrier-like protein
MEFDREKALSNKYLIVTRDKNFIAVVSEVKDSTHLNASLYERKRLKSPELNRFRIAKPYFAEGTEYCDSVAKSTDLFLVNEFAVKTDAGTFIAFKNGKPMPEESLYFCFNSTLYCVNETRLGSYMSTFTKDLYIDLKERTVMWAHKLSFVRSVDLGLDYAIDDFTVEAKTKIYTKQQLLDLGIDSSRIMLIQKLKQPEIDILFKDAVHKTPITKSKSSESINKNKENVDQIRQLLVDMQIRRDQSDQFNEICVLLNKIE